VVVVVLDLDKAAEYQVEKVQAVGVALEETVQELSQMAVKAGQE
jgi:hypothetical protein